MALESKTYLKINTGSLLSTDYRIIRRTFRIVQGVYTSISPFCVGVGMRGRLAEWAIEGLTPVTENCELVIRFNHMI